MTKLQKIEQEIANLSSKDVRKLADWFEEFKAELWDQQIEADVESGTFDALSASVLTDHKSGKTEPL